MSRSASSEDPRPVTAGRSSPAVSISRKLLVAVVALALVTVLIMDGLRTLGAYMPFSVERNVALNYVTELPKPGPATEALNAFGEKIAALQGLPTGIPVEVHIIPHESVQAFATLGGHILIYRGLLEKLRSEDELAALLAHQIAHLSGRHPVQALGKRVSVGMLLSVFSHDLAEEFARPSFHASLRTAPSFTRDHEIDTLRATGATLISLYGHLGGALDLSKSLRGLATTQPEAIPRILESHPGLEHLDRDLQPVAQEQGWSLDNVEAKRRPLAKVIAGADTPSAGTN